MKVVVAVPSIRPNKMEQFKKAWAALFEKHQAVLVTVWDGESPSVVCEDYGSKRMSDDTVPAVSGFGPVLTTEPFRSNSSLFYRFTDSCRNIGFVVAAQMMDSPDDVLITMDDDVAPLLYKSDPIQAHLDALSRRAPISWMNTAHDTDLYLRGVPYGVRDEAPVMLSHGVWVGVPDFDGETQLRLEDKGELPYSLPYFVGPVPKGVLFSVCGMNLAVKRDAIPYLYFAPMGPDSGVKELNRFADIWMGVFAKREFDRLGWACVTGYSTVLHTRASDARKNFEQEKLGREWNERFGLGVPPERVVGMVNNPPGFTDYMISYAQKREQFRDLIQGIIGKGDGK